MSGCRVSHERKFHSHRGGGSPTHKTVSRPVRCVWKHSKELSHPEKERHKQSQATRINNMSALAQSQKRKAEEYIAQAEATLNKRSWFSSSKERNQEDAAELYLQAANAYKVGGLQQEAGEIYTQAADLFRDKLSNPNEAAKAYSNAGECSMIDTARCLDFLPLLLTSVYCY